MPHMSIPTAFAGEIPENYDTYLGPLLFSFSAQDLAKRVERMVPEGELLEVACGTGVSTEYLRKALKDSISILATDVSDAMLVAQEVIQQYFVDNPPRFIELPFGFYNIETITRLMEGAGYTDCRSEV